MQRFIVDIETGNDAFGSSDLDEVQRHARTRETLADLFEELSNTLRGPKRIPTVLRDENGNKVGTVTVVE